MRSTRITPPSLTGHAMNFKSFRNVGLLVVAIILGLIALKQLYVFAHWVKKPAVVGSDTAAAAARPAAPVAQASVASPVCDGVRKPITFPAAAEQKVQFNLNGYCSSQVWFPTDKCLYYQQAGSTKQVGPVCWGGKDVQDGEYFWSASGEAFDGSFQLNAPKYTAFVEFRQK